MEALRIQEIVEATKGTLVCGDPGARVTGVSTDTRSLAPGDLFFALVGERDGHEFIPAALRAGAGGLIVSDPCVLPPDCPVPVVEVRDTLWALGELAAYYRSKFDVRVIGITGSVGKTTTKEMLASILERKWNVLKNEMNYNNEIGVPLTLFRLERGHDVVILEMAMRGLQEIRRLAQIARPRIGIITNIGMSHIERLGSQSAIAEAKSELLAELPPDGIAVLNAEDGYYPVMKERFPGRVVSFGSCKHADVIGARIKREEQGTYSFVVMIEGGAIEVGMPILGYHNVFNALAASAAAVALGIDLYTIRDGLQAFAPPSMRMEMLETPGGYAVVNDAYNANPASMSAAIRTLKSLGTYKRRVAVLGDMLELGDYSEKAHHDLGSAVAEGSIDLLVAVGPSSRLIADGALESGFPADAVHWYSDSREASLEIRKYLKKGDAVMVKGSRGMKMERIVEVLAGE
ncbi:MAG: UDP-N-acetylmuramoyl-tripeptide--D-alanyl-D-alanine ligase [Armatimonadota bacterium]